MSLILYLRRPPKKRSSKGKGSKSRAAFFSELDNMLTEVFQTDVNNLPEEFQDVLYNVELEGYTLHKESINKVDFNEDSLPEALAEVLLNSVNYSIKSNTRYDHVLSKVAEIINPNIQVSHTEGMFEPQYNIDSFMYQFVNNMNLILKDKMRICELNETPEDSMGTNATLDMIVDVLVNSSLLTCSSDSGRIPEKIIEDLYVKLSNVVVKH